MTVENKTLSVNPKELAVLEVLAEDFNADSNCWYFKSIASVTKLTIKEVRRACRSLAKKGFASYERGLFDEDGQTAGSGYCATRKGAAYISPCDICGDLSCYDYTSEASGARILECEEHYKKSPCHQRKLIAV